MKLLWCWSSEEVRYFFPEIIQSICLIDIFYQLPSLEVFDASFELTSRTWYQYQFLFFHIISPTISYESSRLHVLNEPGYLLFHQVYPHFPTTLITHRDEIVDRVLVKSFSATFAFFLIHVEVIRHDNYKYYEVLNV